MGIFNEHSIISSSASGIKGPKGERGPAGPGCLLTLKGNYDIQNKKTG